MEPRNFEDSLKRKGNLPSSSTPLPTLRSGREAKRNLDDQQPDLDSLFISLPISRLRRIPFVGEAEPWAQRNGNVGKRKKEKRNRGLEAVVWEQGGNRRSYACVFLLTFSLAAVAGSKGKKKAKIDA